MMARRTECVPHRHAISATARIGSCGAWLLFGLLPVLWAAAPAVVPAAEAVEVANVVLSEQSLAPGREQIVQVTLRNNGAAQAGVGVRITLADKAGKPLQKPLQRAVTIPGYDEQRVYFTLKAPRSTGEYRVLLGLFSADFKRRLDAKEPAFYATFAVIVPGQRAPAAPAPAPEAGGPGATAMQKPPLPGFAPPAGLQFEAPDLLWENIDVTPPSFLVGDTGRVRGELVNVGGDVARDVAVRVRYFNSRIPNKIDPIADSVVAALAPGERIELEWEFKFPDSALLGEYRVVLDAAPPEGMADANPANNRGSFAKLVQLNNIRQVFPDQDYVFDEAGLFLFRWETKVYKEFKVQVGVDSAFQDPSRFFDIPQGDKWAVEQEIVPLEGELPVMARGLMERFTADLVYWRVMGRDVEQNRTGFSRVQQFTIRLGAAKPELQGPEETEEGVPEPVAPPSGDIVPPLPPVVPPPPAQGAQSEGTPPPGGSPQTAPAQGQPAQGTAEPPPASESGTTSPPGQTAPAQGPAQGAAPPADQ